MTTTDHDAFLPDILADPFDDTPRLVFADWLDENAGDVACPRCEGGEYWGKRGYPRPEVVTLKPPLQPKDICIRCHGEDTVSDGRRERAEFIRVQCELAKLDIEYARRVKTDLWLGRSDVVAQQVALRRREGELLADCGVCDVNFGVTSLLFDGLVVPCAVSRGFPDAITCDLRTLFGDWCELCGGMGSLIREGGPPCSACKGTRREGSVAPTLFAAHPITAVRLTDRQPLEVFPDVWCWGRSYTTVLEEHHRLPSAVFDLLHDNSRHTERVDYPTREAAHAALSNALVAWGRSVAEGHTHEATCTACSGEGCSQHGHGDRGEFCDGSGTVTRPGLPPLGTPVAPNPAADPPVRPGEDSHGEGRRTLP